MMNRSGFALCLLLLLAACGGGGPASDKFILRSDESAFSGITHHRHAREGTLKIVLPVGAPGLDSVQVAVLQEGGQFNFAAGKEWVEPLPKLVQAQLVEAFEQANLYSAVVPDSQGVTSRASLMTDIREFAFDETNGGKVKVRLVARIVNPASRNVVSSVSSSQSAAVEGGSVMNAFNEASGRAVKDIVEKLARRLR